MNKTDELCVNTLRFLAVDAVEKAKSGHPGLPLGAAPIAYVVWDRFLKHSPENPAWFVKPGKCWTKMWRLTGPWVVTASGCSKTKVGS